MRKSRKKRRRQVKKSRRRVDIDSEEEEEDWGYNPKDKAYRGSLSKKGKEAISDQQLRPLASLRTTNALGVNLDNIHGVIREDF